MLQKVSPIGIILVEICDGNLLAAFALEELETKYPEVAVLRTECLSRCGLCRVRPFALVNGERIFADSAEECLRLIEEKIQAELAFYD
jgi:uncharacterized protein YuzB (UPF0349 family)